MNHASVARLPTTNSFHEASVAQIESLFRLKDLETDKCKSSIHDHIHAMQLAIHAAELKARPPIIEALVGIKISTALQIYRQVNGLAFAPRGQLPNEPTYYMKTPQRHLDSVWFVKTYLMLRMGGEERAKAIINAYRHYLNITHLNGRDKLGKNVISFDRAYYLVRHFEISKILNMTTCSRCNCDFLYRDLELPDEGKYCPVCNFNKD